MAEIEITGAQKHNLKNISLNIPKRKIICITGVSGSGKSSLAYDTIFQEGQRKYLESLSFYARRFIKSLEKADVQSIKGISPTISIDQRQSSFFYNSTVGTLSEVSHYLRLLFARVYDVRCPYCSKEIKTYSSNRISDFIFKNFSQKLVYIFAPVVRNRKGNHKTLFEKYQKRGYLKAIIDGKIHYLDDLPSINKNIPHTISILIDVVQVLPENTTQIEESASLAAFESHGEIIVTHDDKEYFFSNNLYCQDCDISIALPQPATFSLNSPIAVCGLCKGRGENENQENCWKCKGSGFNQWALSFYFRGKNIYQLGEMEVENLLDFFEDIVLTNEEEPLLVQILPQIIQRLKSFVKLNLGYITLNRKIHTISGGELQRTRLVSQIGFSLSGIIYILDEPSIGMHMSEQENLLEILTRLKRSDNTIILVEHDEMAIRSSDYIVDLGPGAGEKGGYLKYCGWIKDFSLSKESLTADYIFKRKSISYHKPYQFNASNFIEIKGISINNICKENAYIPINALTVVSGVSGSGKSSLIIDGLYPILKSEFDKVKLNQPRLKFQILKGIDTLERVMMVTQASIGKNARSCPATYINVMSMIRELFANLPEAKMKGYGPKRFSFNTKGGRCEACEGLGVKKIEMSFLPEVEVNCPVCEGSRFNSETLQVKYKGLSIADVLELTSSEAFQLFKDIPFLSKRLKILIDVGLGYLRLGQSSLTLSGGESQRIKLTRELSRISRKPTVYLLDEPTIGLHFDDIQRLIDVFHGLIVKGNTVVVIEHNIDLIRAADYIIDMGPGGGKKGGGILYQGECQGLFLVEESLTGQYIRKLKE